VCGKSPKDSQWGLSTAIDGFCLPLPAPKVPVELSIVGGNLGYPRLGFLGAIGVAPSAAVAVDNPFGIVPGCGQRTRSNGAPAALLLGVCGHLL